MGHIEIELTEYAEQEDPKNVKLILTDGEFTGGVLRTTICAKMLEDGAASDDELDDDIEDGSDGVEEEEDDGKPKGPTVEEYAKAREERLQRIRSMEQKEKERKEEEQQDARNSQKRRVVRRQKTEMDRYREAGLLCQMCDERLPKLKCHECVRETCEDCDIGLHGSGPMAAHYREEIEPPELPPLPEQEKPAARGAGGVRSRSLKDKIEAVMHIAKVPFPDAKRYLEEADWDVDSACERARMDPNAVSKPSLKKGKSKEKTKKKVQIVEDGQEETEEQKQQRLQQQRLKQQAMVREMLKKGKGSLPSEDGFSTDDGAGVGAPRRAFDSAPGEDTGPGEDDMDDIESDNSEDVKPASDPPKRASRYEQENENANARPAGRRGVYKSVDNDEEEDASSSRRSTSRREDKSATEEKSSNKKKSQAADASSFFSFDAMLDAISGPLNRTCAAPRDNDWFQSMLAGKWTAEDSSAEESDGDNEEEAGASPGDSDNPQDNDFM